ncbi:MAG TPA: pitrilysin family protein [Candidatus Saccharimonadales bacterium]|nr:pitrilysin family protein [Candidatus Saccharimonadales bacterium]
MKFETSKLSNGLRIISARMPQAQSVAVAMLAGVGSRHEDYPKNGGVSHFLEHLLFKGTKKRPSTQVIAEAVDGVGGNNNAYTTNDLTNYYIKLPRKHTDLALDILSDMIQNPLLDPAEVDRERGAVIEEMNMRRDDPASFVHMVFPELLWPSDPLGRAVIGSEEVIKTISRDAIAEYQALHYSPDNLVVAVAGDVQHDHITAQIDSLMGAMKPHTLPKFDQLNSTLAADRVKAVTKQTNQAHIVIGCQAYPYNHRLDMAARVMTNMLGAGLSSRLFINVRERQGLAYSVYADYDNFVDAGEFDVYAGVNLDKIPQAISSVMAELTRVRQEAVGEAELTKVKNKMSGGLQMALENTFAVADRVGRRLVLLDQVKTPEETLAEIEQVTAEDVMAAARDLLEPGKLRMAIIAPDTTEAATRFEELTAA